MLTIPARRLSQNLLLKCIRPSLSDRPVRSSQYAHRLLLASKSIAKVTCMSIHTKYCGNGREKKVFLWGSAVHTSSLLPGSACFSFMQRTSCAMSGQRTSLSVGTNRGAVLHECCKLPDEQSSFLEGAFALVCARARDCKKAY